MRVCLINPPASNGIKMVREGRCMQRKGAWTTVWPPVTLATMAAMLIKEGFEVFLSDCIVEDISHEKLKTKIAYFKPDLVVINTATASIYTDLDCARIAKSVNSGIKTLAFGIHVTALPDEAFTLCRELDFVIRGEPEFCLLELAGKLRSNDPDYSQIKGLSLRLGQNIGHNPDCDFLDSLDKLPFPAWELVNVNNYLLPFESEPFLLVTTSKGCSHACIFCPAKPFYGRILRLRDYRSVVNEMAYVKEKFKVKNFLIWSESFTENKDYVKKLCEELINRKLFLRWACNSRVDRVDRELLSLMKSAGCWMVGFGIESGSQEVLDINKKGITVTQAENAVSLAKEAGLEVTAHVIFGLPGETKQTGLATIEWLNRLPIDFAQFYCAVAWPTTPLYKIAKEKNWLSSCDWRNFEQNNYLLDMGTIARQDVEYLRKRAMRKFYSTPRRIFNILGRLNSPGKVISFFKMAKEFLSWI